jgi:deuterolysin
VRFIGAHARISRDNLSTDSFVTVKRKQSVDVKFDLARLYDIREGGQFIVVAGGGIPWAKKHSTTILGTAPFTSNNLTISVGKSSKIPLAKNVLQSDCVDGRFDATRAANNACAMISMVAGIKALTGEPEMQVLPILTKSDC